MRLSKTILTMIKDDKLQKGNVINVARIAGIMGAKQTSSLIPLCHNINLDSSDISFRFLEEELEIVSTVKSEEKTGVEMEALTAVTVSALTIYDMVKGVDKSVYIKDISLLEKKGEIVLINSHIASYKQASYSNHNPTDERKLLLNKREINKLIGKMQRDGLTIVPTKMYFKKGKAKLELAVAKGKKQFDKRAVKKQRDWNRDRARYIRKSS